MQSMSTTGRKQRRNLFFEKLLMMMIFAEYEDIFVLNFKASKGITRSQGLTQFFICWVFGWLVL